MLHPTPFMIKPTVGMLGCEFGTKRALVVNKYLFLTVFLWEYIICLGQTRNQLERVKTEQNYRSLVNSSHSQDNNFAFS